MTIELKHLRACMGFVVLLGACAPIEDGEPEEMEPESMGMGDMPAQPSDKIDKGGMWGLDVFRTGVGTGTIIGTNLSDNRRVITCGTDCAEDFLFIDQTVTLQATAADGSSFTGWSGACSGTAPTCTVRVTMAGTDVWANFAGQPLITMQVTGVNGSTTMTAGRPDGSGPQETCSSNYNGISVCGSGWPPGTPMKVELYPGLFTNNPCPNPVVVTRAWVGNKLSPYPRSTCTYTTGSTGIIFKGKYHVDTGHYGPR